MHFGSMLSVFPCIINAQPWRSALPLIGLTAWADVRGLANSLFTPLHCSERVRDFNETKQGVPLHHSLFDNATTSCLALFTAPPSPSGIRCSRVCVVSLSTNMTEITFYTTAAKNKQAHRVQVPATALTFAAAAQRFTSIATLNEDGFASFLDSDEFAKQRRTREPAAHCLLLAWHRFPDDIKKNVERGKRSISSNGSFVCKTLAVYAAMLVHDYSLPDGITLAAFDRVAVSVTASSHLLSVLFTSLAERDGKREKKLEQDETKDNVLLTCVDELLQEEPLIQSFLDIRVHEGKLQYDIVRLGDEKPAKSRRKEWMSHDKLWADQANHAAISKSQRQWAEAVDELVAKRDGRLLVCWREEKQGHDVVILTVQQAKQLGWMHLITGLRSSTAAGAAASVGDNMDVSLQSLSLSQSIPSATASSLSSSSSAAVNGDDIDLRVVSGRQFEEFLSWQAKQKSARRGRLRARSLQKPASADLSIQSGTRKALSKRGEESEEANGDSEGGDEEDEKQEGDVQADKKQHEEKKEEVDKEEEQEGKTTAEEGGNDKSSSSVEETRDNAEDGKEEKTQQEVQVILTRGKRGRDVS